MRFVICTSRRAGGMMVASALYNHPDILLAGDVLQGSPTRYLGDSDPPPSCTADLLDRILQEYTGFVVFLGEETPGTWEYLTCRSDVVFLVVLRRNILASYASLQLAKRTQQWYRPSDGCWSLRLSMAAHSLRTPRRDVASQQLSAKEADSYIMLEAERRKTLLQLLSARNRSVLTLYYEDFCCRWSHYIRMTLNFLGLSARPLYPPIFQLPAALPVCPLKREQHNPYGVSNLEQFCKQSAGYVWSYMLEALRCRKTVPV